MTRKNCFKIKVSISAFVDLFLVTDSENNYFEYFVDLLKFVLNLFKIQFY